MCSSSRPTIISFKCLQRSEEADAGASLPQATFRDKLTAGDQPDEDFAAAGSGDTPLATATNLVNEGGNQQHNNMQPYLTISYLIATQGIFPSRS